MGNRSNLWSRNSCLFDNVIAAEYILRPPVRDNMLIRHDNNTLKRTDNELHIVRYDNDRRILSLQMVQNIAQDRNMPAILSCSGLIPDRIARLCRKYRRDRYKFSSGVAMAGFFYEY